MNASTVDKTRTSSVLCSSDRLQLHSLGRNHSSAYRWPITVRYYEWPNSVLRFPVHLISTPSRCDKPTHLQLTLGPVRLDRVERSERTNSEQRKWDLLEPGPSMVPFLALIVLHNHTHTYKHIHDFILVCLRSALYHSVSSLEIHSALPNGRKLHNDWEYPILARPSY